MAEQQDGCRRNAWLGGAAAGLLVAAFLLVVSHQSVLTALFFGVVTLILFGGFLVWAFCTGSSAETVPPAAPAKPDTPKAAAKPVAPPAAPEAPAKGPTAQIAASAPAPATTAGSAPDSAKPMGLASGAPTTRVEPSDGAVPASVAAGGAAITPASKPAAKPAEPKAKPVLQAPGEAEVAAAGEGKKPHGLKAPRKAGADDLKAIEGIGPKLEEVLNGWGVFHYDQIAKWGAAEVAYADQNVPRFKGRCSRDKWVAQAIIIVEEGMDAFLEKAKTNDY